jgi:DNA mismatch repair protein MutS
MALYDEYESYMNKYIKEYGKNTIVLYRCGSFYEIYSINDGLVDMKKICEILNIQMSKRNKAVIEVNRSNSLMCGFPMYTLHKFVALLIDENYTVVVVDQISEAPKPKRAVTSIISPGTDINNVQSFDTNILMSIYIQKTLDYSSKKNVLIIGLSMIDLTTGISKVCEISSTHSDPYLSLDEVFRIIQVENPREIIIFGDDTDFDIIQYLEISNKCVHNKGLNFNKEVQNINYQKQLLQKVFPNTGLLSVIEYLDLEKYPIAIVSFVFLLQFSFQHNENILNHIQKPDIIINSDKLILSYNCVKHLNIISTDSRINSLLSILNRCSSAIGKRLFKDWFLNPITETQELDKRYKRVDFMLNGKLFEKLQKLLQDVYDIERLLRKIGLNTIHPCEYQQLYITCNTVINILLETKNSGCMEHESDNIINQIKSLTSYIDNNLDLVEASKYNLDTIIGSFFKDNVSELIEEKKIKLRGVTDFYEILLIKLNEAVKQDLFKLDDNLNDGHHLVITVKRYNDVKKSIEDFKFKFLDYTFDFKKATFKQVSTSYKILHPTFKIINDDISKCSNDLIELVKKRYNEFTLECFEKFEGTMKLMINVIGETDFYSTVAKNSFNYRYYKPKIIDSQNETSYITGKNLRHPIIERINSNTEYIPNDVSIGVDEITGMLLYGTNMVGKSAYMKSIGISVIMAQCGMFVPCEDFVYYPFKSIFTRIPSGDDLFKNQSTFAVEINELRNILKRANVNSLVIGDELASGTESISAVSIVASGIIQLNNKKSKFVFATHLHDLTNLKAISTLKTLKIYHLSVIYDETTKKLIYNRKLQDGQGSTMYGLEVCRALDLPSEFLLTANQFRQELLNINSNILNTQTSQYNKKHYVDNCSVCGEKAEEVHHIKEQMLADKDGFIGENHKNSKHNLMNVCEKCHDKIHHGEIKVNGYIQTSDGIELDVKTVEKINDIEDDLKKKVNLYRNDLKLSVNKIKEKLKEDGFTISNYKINKLLN